MSDTNSIITELAVTQIDASEMNDKYLTFFTDNQLFGVPIADVVQIVQIQPITIIPEFPSYAKGIINLRGSVIPVIDMRLRMGKEEIPYDDHTCIIVTLIENSAMGFIVDSVDEVADIPADEISPPPKVSEREVGGAYLTGVGQHDKRVVLLIDTKKILNQDEFDIISQN